MNRKKKEKKKRPTKPIDENYAQLAGGRWLSVQTLRTDVTAVVGNRRSVTLVEPKPYFVVSCPPPLPPARLEAASRYEIRFCCVQCDQSSAAHIPRNGVGSARARQAQRLHKKIFTIHWPYTKTSRRSPSHRDPIGSWLDRPSLARAFYFYSFLYY